MLRLDFLEVLDLKPIAGAGARVRSPPGAGETVWAGLPGGRGRRHQFRNVGKPCPGRGGSCWSHKVVVAKLAARQGGADGLGIQPAFEFQAIGMKDIPAAHDFRPYAIGFRIEAILS